MQTKQHILNWVTGMLK